MSTARSSETYTPILSVQGLSKRYGLVVGCQDVSFDLCAGEVLGIVGESGSGKTTVLKCLSGQLTPSGGAGCLRCGSCRLERHLWTRGA